MASAVGTFGKIRLPLTQMKWPDGMYLPLTVYDTHKIDTYSTVLQYNNTVGGRLACAQIFKMLEAIFIWK